MKAKDRELIRRGEELAGVMGMAQGMAMRVSYGHTGYAYMVEGALHLARSLERPEIVDAIEYGYEHPRVSSDERLAEIERIRRQYGMMPECGYCNGSGKKEKLLGGGTCRHCLGTGRMQ